IDYLDSRFGPLDYLKPSQVDRIEINLQLFRLPAGAKPDFGGDAEYLLRVFRREGAGKPFLATRLENQVNRNELLANPKKLMAFKTWLFTRMALADLDRGTLDIPWEFLTDRAISISPGSGSRSANQPYLGIFTEEEVRAAIAKYESFGQRLQRI